MVEPKVGVTHDIVIYVNNSLFCGLTVEPHSFRVRHLPTFIPQLTVGDITGRDTSRWKSFVQSSFHQGAGQYFWSSPSANGGYAESNMFDIGSPTTTAGIVMRDDPGFAFGTNLAPSGHAIVAAVPQAMTALSNQGRIFTAVYPVFLLEFSSAPHVYNGMKALCYTNKVGGEAWAANLTGRPQDDLSGVWANVPVPTATDTLGVALAAPFVSAVKFSGVLITALNNGKMNVWGPTNSTSSPPLVQLMEPAYSTVATKLCEYDTKLWKADRGTISYLTPVGSTTNGWCEPYTLADVTVPVTNMCEWAGRLYIGKEDGLYVFDAGKTYVVQEYRQERSSGNFGLMLAHRGALYYNIRNQLYRLTGTGMIELIRTPWFGGNILSGVSYIHELIFIVGGAGAGGSGTSSVWVFDAETGGTRQWYTGIGQQSVDPDLALATSPSFIGALRGYVFVAPQYLTGTVSAGSMAYATPIIATNRASFTEARQFDGAQLVTSGFDFGLPSLEKEFGYLKVDTKMDSFSSMEVHIAAAPRQLPSFMASTPERIWTVLDSTLLYTASAMSCNNAAYVAFAFDAPQRDYSTEGSVTPIDGLVSEYLLEYMHNRQWTPAPAEVVSAGAFSGTGSHAVLVNLGNLTDWSRGPIIEEAGGDVYGIRDRFMNVVPSTFTVVNNTIFVVPNAIRVYNVMAVCNSGKLSVS